MCPSIPFLLVTDSHPRTTNARLPLWRLVTTARSSALARIVVLGLARPPFRLLAMIVSCRHRRRLFWQWGWWWGTVTARVEVRGRGIVVRRVWRREGAVAGAVATTTATNIITATRLLLLRHSCPSRHLNAHTLCCSWLVECRITAGIAAAAAAASLPPTTGLLLLVRLWKVTNNCITSDRNIETTPKNGK